MSQKKNKLNIELNNFLDKIKNENIVLFGASSRGKRVLFNLIEHGFSIEKIVFCDNSSEKWGEQLEDVRIISPMELEKYDKNICIIISTSMHEEVFTQLTTLGFTNVNYYHTLIFPERIYEKYDSKFYEILEKTRNRCYLDSEEKYTIYSALKSIEYLDGDIAEVGVYKGGSAKILCEMKGNKQVFLFDTFEGLPKTRSDENVQEGWLNNTTLESVKEYLSEYDNVFYFKGIFPKTAEKISDKKFSFVHLDTDTYQSTLDSLHFFWPKLTNGGRIISHDYNAINIIGIKKAFLEFFIDHPEKIIEIADSQVLVLKS